MTRWTSPEPEKDSPLLSILPALDPIDNRSLSNYKSSTANTSEIEDPLASKMEEECSTVTSVSELPVEEGISESTETVNTRGIRDVYKTPIPLPAPSSASYAVGTACGGNQSYVGLKDSVRRLPDSNMSSPDYLNGSFSSTVNPVSVRSAGVVGLNNLGNTCFMNSGLQCLINTAPVVEFFLKSENISGVAPIKTALVAQFQSLIRNAWLGTVSTLPLQDFKNVLGNNYSQFKDCRQHDCQEFLALTLDVLHEQLKTWNSFKKGEENILNSSSSSKDVSPTSNRSTVEELLKSPKSDGENSESSEIKIESLSPQTKRRKMDGERSDGSPLNNQNIEIDTPLIVNGHSEEVNTNPIDKISNNISLEAQAKLASEFWTSYIKDNNTVIASSFQGMYKSTVTCSECHYISRTYEPFMYLSLPIPRIMERQFSVTFSSYKDPRPQKIDVTLTIGDSVERLKEEVLKKVSGDLQLGAPLSSYMVAEIVNYHVHRILEDDAPLKSVCDGNRNIYVYELNQNFDDLNETVVYGPCLEEAVTSEFPGSTFQCGLKPMTYLNEDWENEDSAPFPQSSSFTPPPSQTFVPSGDSGVSSAGQSSYENSSQTVNDAAQANMGWIACAVCLEDFKKPDLRRHCACSCILCADCMKKCASLFIANEKEQARSETEMKCPVCAAVVDYEKSFIPLVDTSQGLYRKLTTVPLLFRYEPIKDANNNSPVVSKLFNHPWLVKIPSVMQATEFIEFIDSVNPFPDHSFKVVNASWDGKTCGQCVYSISCRGCELATEGIIAINPRNSILISYSNLSSDLVASVEPPDMAIQTGFISNVGLNRREEPAIDIHECLHAFSEIEYLDDQNPWFCPECKKNQCATKALTICRFPDYLIVYLKRFVFVDHSSNKLNNQLKFPTNDLDVSQYIAEEFSGTQHVYDLYSCVCHYGTASSGHYTAFGKNPVNGSWHYFNDESYTPKIPAEPEFASAYVLFYERKGLKSDIPLSRRISPVQQRFRFSSSFLGDRDVSKGTSSRLPESVEGFAIGTCGVTIDKDAAKDIIGCLPIDQQEELMASELPEASEGEPTFYHKSSIATVTEDQPKSPISSEKLNGVREDVSNLHIMESNDMSVRRKQPTRCKTILSASRFREGIDVNDEGFTSSDFLKKPHSNFILDISRPTKIATRPKNPHSGLPCTDQLMDN